jgi:DNA-binding LytR/AlgR family response regulator
MALKCLVIDDEPVALEILSDYIAKLPFLENQGSIRDPLKALDILSKEDIDLIFLDINMPDLTGIQFLKSLTNPPLVIFTTAYSEYAVESYDYDAVDYLLKPIEFDRFLKAVNKAYKIYQTKDLGLSLTDKNSVDFVILKSGKKYYRINPRDIYYVRGTGNYVTFVTKKKEILCLLTMQGALEKLPAAIFFRIHKSYIINLLHVDLMDIDRVRIKGKDLPIGDTFRESFFQAVSSRRLK